MGFPSLLVTKGRYDNVGTEEGAAYVLEGGVTLRRIGAAFGASTVETPGNNFHRGCNRTIKFNGKLYSWTRNVIREYDPGTGLWTTSLTIADPLASEQNAYHSGLYFAVLGGKPSIFGVYQNSGSLCKGVVFDGTAWTTYTGPTAASLGHFGPGFVFRNRLILPTGFNGANRHLTFDPNTGSMDYTSSNSASESNSRAGGCYVTFRGRLLGVFITNPTNRTQVLFEFQGSQWMQLQNLLVGANNTTDSQWGSYAWSTPSAIYVFALYHPVSGQPTFRLLKLTPTGAGTSMGETFTITDISNPVVPPALRGNVTNNHYIEGFVDNLVPTAPRVFLRTLSNPAIGNASSAAVYEFVDDVTEMVFHGLGPSTAVGWPHSNWGGGEYVWNDVDQLQMLDVVVEKLQGISGGTRISFRCKGGDNTIARTVKLYYSTTDGPDMALCTLVPSTATGGATNTAGQVGNINDDGSILYTVDWDSIGQGVDPEAKVAMVGTVE